MTKEEAARMVIEAGYRVGTNYDDGRRIYACSVETHGPASYGHPKYEVSYSRETGRLAVIGEKRQS